MMKTAEKAGICMDHAHANIIEFSDEPATAKMVYSDFSKQDKNETLQRGEGEMHQKEQHQTLAYYKPCQQSLGIMTKSFSLARPMPKRSCSII